jgi:hypothetical protein
VARKSSFNPTEDQQFESLARLLAPQRRKRRKIERVEEDNALDVDRNLRRARPQYDYADDETDNYLTLRDFLQPGAGLASPAPIFDLPLSDAGDGAVNTTPTYGTAATFTRATVASCRLSSGLLKKVASGVARSHYSAAGAYLGYYAEGARTNLCLQSEDLTTSWVNTRSSESANATAAPDGTSTADKLIEDATAGATHLITITQATITSGATQSVSGFFKAGERSWVLLQCADATLTNFFGAYFDLTNGATGANDVAGAGAVSAKSIESWGNGWYRCVVTGAVNGGVTSAGVRIYTANADSGKTYNGDNSSGLYCWGLQHEEASFASSYIPTTTIAVARNADILSYPICSIDVLGSAYVEYTASVAGIAQAYLLDPAASSGRSFLYRHSSNTLASFDGTTLVNSSALNDTVTNKLASSWGSKQRNVKNGGTVATGAFDGSYAIGTSLVVGALANGSSGAFGALKNVRLWSVEKSPEELQELTA